MDSTAGSGECATVAGSFALHRKMYEERSWGLDEKHDTIGLVGLKPKFSPNDVRRAGRWHSRAARAPSRASSRV